MLTTHLGLEPLLWSFVEDIRFAGFSHLFEGSLIRTHVDEAKIVSPLDHRLYNELYHQPTRRVQRAGNNNERV